jgi:protein CpxP
MKKLILIASAFMFGIAANAQTNQAQPIQGQSQQNRTQQPRDAKTQATRLTQKMTKQLALTNDIRAKVYDVNYSTAQKIIDLRAKYSGDKKAMAPERKKITQERDEQLKTLLSPEQFAKWEQLKKSLMKKNRQNKRHSSAPNQNDTNQGN